MCGYIGKRLRESRGDTKTSDAKPSTSTSLPSNAISITQTVETVQSGHNIECPFQSHAIGSESSFPHNNSQTVFSATPSLTPESIPTVPQQDYQLAIAPIHQPQIPISVHGALYINGRLLGLKCSNTIPSKSTPATPDLPLPLYPTPIQLLTVHHRWLDMFPFPKMRDNAITMSAVIDEEEFLADLFIIPSFTILPGRACWDPRGWRMERGFAEKWGYLFY